MKLDKEDLKQIRGVVKEEVTVAKNEIVATLSREINDLANINRAVIGQISKIGELEKRIIRIEHKVGIAS
jgi:hypothetical protein